MTSLQKQTDRFLKNPGSFKYHQVEKMLLSFGFQKIPAAGSHVKFKHKKLDKDLVIPVHNNDCKEFYKKIAAKICRNL